MLSTTPATWSVGEKPTATKMNTEIRDALTNLQAAWTAYTPAWAATSTNPTIGNGTLTGSYTRTGKSVLWRITLVPGSTTTFGTGAYSLSLPLAPLVGGYMGGALMLGSRWWVGGCVTATSTTVNVILQDTTAVAWSPTVPWTLASGNTVYLSGVYEAA